MHRRTDMLNACLSHLFFFSYYLDLHLQALVALLNPAAPLPTNTSFHLSSTSSVSLMASSSLESRLVGAAALFSEAKVTRWAVYDLVDRWQPASLASLMPAFHVALVLDAGACNCMQICAPGMTSSKPLMTWHQKRHLPSKVLVGVFSTWLSAA